MTTVDKDQATKDQDTVAEVVGDGSSAGRTAATRMAGTISRSTRGSAARISTGKTRTVTSGRS